MLTSLTKASSNCTPLTERGLQLSVLCKVSKWEAIQYHHKGQDNRYFCLDLLDFFPSA